MQKFSKAALFLLMAIALLSFDPKPKTKVTWISFAELEELYAKSPRPILVDLYTSWCGWCKEMDRTTYSNEKVATYINEHYYAVKYNAESRDSVRFNKIKYGFNKAAATNDLALYLSAGERSYPNSIFLSDPSSQPAALSGYMKAKEMEAPLRYFVEKRSNETFVEFSKGMKSIW